MEITKDYLLNERAMLQEKLMQAQMEHFGVEGALAYIERLLAIIEQHVPISNQPEGGESIAPVSEKEEDNDR